MSPGHRWFEEPDDESDDGEFPEDSGFGDAEPDTIRCPECGADVYDDAVQCPTCGTYLDGGHQPLVRAVALVDRPGTPGGRRRRCRLDRTGPWYRGLDTDPNLPSGGMIRKTGK